MIFSENRCPLFGIMRAFCACISRMVRTRRRRISLRMAARCSVKNSSVKATAMISSGHRMDGSMAEPPHAHDRSRLMQRVPPVDRELDDREVDRADQSEHRRRARAAAGILGGPIEREHAEIEQEQHQHRGQPRIPHPIGAPGRAAPERAGDETNEGEGGADRRRRLARDIGQRMPPYQRAERGERSSRPSPSCRARPPARAGT